MWNVRDSSVTASDPGSRRRQGGANACGSLPVDADGEAALHQTSLEGKPPAARLRRPQGAREDMLARIKRPGLGEPHRKRAAACGSHAPAPNDEVDADAVLA